MALKYFAGVYSLAIIFRAIQTLYFISGPAIKPSSFQNTAFQFTEDIKVLLEK